MRLALLAGVWLTALAANSAAAELRPDPLAVACNGEGDDAPALNAAIASVRARAPASRFAWAVGKAGRVRVSGAPCVLRTTLDLTHLYGSGFVLDAWGAEFVCSTGDAPCVDATGSGQLSLLGLNLIGQCEGATPRIGLALGRKTDSLSQGADHNDLEHPTLAGCFGLTAFYNRSSETTHVTAGAFYNYSDHAYAAIWDGTNHFEFQSAFYTERYPSGRFSSFNENLCEACVFETFGHRSIPVWIGGAVRHKFVNGYALAKAAEGEAAVVISFANGAPNDFLDLGLHVENGSLGAAVLISGAERPVLRGLRVEDSYPAQQGPFFARDKGVKRVGLEGFEARIGKMPEAEARGWDDAAAFDVSGTIYSQDGRFEAPTGFSGLYCAAGKCGMR